MKTVNDFDFKNRKVVMRVDFNVPLNEKFEVTDDTRIKAAIPTIKKIIDDGGSVVLLSHLGRPKQGAENKFSLIHTKSTLEKLTGRSVRFSDDCINEESHKLSSSLKPGEILLMENLRFHKEEEKGDQEFAKKLAAHGDFYINDAFGTAHRAHASTTIIANYFNNNNKCLGFVMAGEVASINKVLNQAEKPFTAIIGGAKVSDKILIIEQLLEKANHIIIGGGMAFTFIKALGGKIGNSLCEDERLETAKHLLQKSKEKGVEIHLPVDAVIADKFSNEAQISTAEIEAIPDGWMGLDIGKNTGDNYKKIILNSKTILWNGPMGVFEMSNFETGTKSIAEAIVEATISGAYSLIGGGDSVAAINKYKFGNKVSYVSTGGGALLEYIEQGSLPGVSAIEQE